MLSEMEIFYILSNYKKREHIIAINGYCIEINKGIMILIMY